MKLAAVNKWVWIIGGVIVLAVILYYAGVLKIPGTTTTAAKPRGAQPLTVLPETETNTNAAV